MDEAIKKLNYISVSEAFREAANQHYVDLFSINVMNTRNNIKDEKILEFLNKYPYLKNRYNKSYINSLKNVVIELSDSGQIPKNTTAEKIIQIAFCLYKDDRYYLFNRQKSKEETEKMIKYACKYVRPLSTPPDLKAIYNSIVDLQKEEKKLITIPKITQDKTLIYTLPFYVLYAVAFETKLKNNKDLTHDEQDDIIKKWIELYTKIKNIACKSVDGYKQRVLYIRKNLPEAHLILNNSAIPESILEGYNTLVYKIENKNIKIDRYKGLFSLIGNRDPEDFFDKCYKAIERQTAKIENDEREDIEEDITREVDEFKRGTILISDPVLLYGSIKYYWNSVDQKRHLLETYEKMMKGDTATEAFYNSYDIDTFLNIMNEGKDDNLKVVLKESLTYHLDIIYKIFRTKIMDNNEVKGEYVYEEYCKQYIDLTKQEPKKKGLVYRLPMLLRKLCVPIFSINESYTIDTDCLPDKINNIENQIKERINKINQLIVLSSKVGMPDIMIAKLNQFTLS
jgi:hypothetical protein